MVTRTLLFDQFMDARHSEVISRVASEKKLDDQLTADLENALKGIGKVLLKKGNHSDGIIKLREAVGSIGFNPTKSSITVY